MRTASRIALLADAVSLMALAGAWLALQDIYHGELDTVLEWGALRIALLIVLAFHVFVIALAWKGAEFPRQDPQGYPRDSL